jgi:hypothetical protein
MWQVCRAIMALGLILVSAPCGALAEGEKGAAPVKLRWKLNAGEAFAVQFAHTDEKTTRASETECRVKTDSIIDAHWKGAVRSATRSAAANTAPRRGTTS